MNAKMEFLRLTLENCFPNRWVLSPTILLLELVPDKHVVMI